MKIESGKLFYIDAKMHRGIEAKSFNSGKWKVESGKFPFTSSPIGRGVSNADGEGIPEGRKAGRLEGKLFNISSLSKISSEPLNDMNLASCHLNVLTSEKIAQQVRNDRQSLTDNDLFAYSPIRFSTDTVLSPYRPNALSPENSHTSIPPYLHTSDTFLPSGNRNYTIANPEKVEYFINCRENALPYLSEILQNSKNEEQIVETLYILDRMIDGNVKGIDKMYPVLSRFNDTKSPNIQTFLAGIYRKTQVPDAFGPLVKMLIQNSINPSKSNFDPNEEIGGAILSYINPRFRV